MWAAFSNVGRWVCGYTVMLFRGDDSKVCRCVQSRVVMVVLGGDANVGGVFKCWPLGMVIYHHFLRRGFKSVLLCVEWCGGWNGVGRRCKCGRRFQMFYNHLN